MHSERISEQTYERGRESCRLYVFVFALCSLWQLLFVVARKNAVCLVVVVVVVVVGSTDVVVVVVAFSVAGSQLSVGLFVLTSSKQQLVEVALLQNYFCFPNKKHRHTPKHTQKNTMEIIMGTCACNSTPHFESESEFEFESDSKIQIETKRDRTQNAHTANATPTVTATATISKAPMGPLSLSFLLRSRRRRRRRLPLSWRCESVCVCG